MSTYSQLPGQLNLAFRAGDQLGTTIDFDIQLTGHTVSSQIVSLVTGTAVASITASVSNPEAGVVSIAMSETATASLTPGTYRWLLTWDAPGDVRRTALNGFCEVVP
jgi:hypothetical protein